MNEHFGSVEPRAYGKHRPAQTRKRHLRRVETPEPSAQRGGIGYAIRIFDRGRRSFPTTTLYEIAAQRMTTCDQAVMAVGRREWRQESKRLSASVANPAANPDPIMLFIMSLLASATVTDDGILLTDWTPAQDDFRARLGPIGFEVALGRRKWDKQYRDRGGPARDVGLSQDPNSRAGSSPPEKNPDWKRITPFD
jgi:hypothetical protein